MGPHNGRYDLLQLECHIHDKPKPHLVQFVAGERLSQKIVEVPHLLPQSVELYIRSNVHIVRTNGQWM